MPDDQALSPQDIQDLQQIATHLPAGHPMAGKVSALLNSQPTQFEQQRSGGPGFWGNVKSSVGLDQPLPTLGQAAVEGMMPEIGPLKSAYDTVTHAPGRISREWQADKGMNLPGRVAAAGSAAVSPMLGIDPDRMRVSAEHGDTAGVLGQAAVPTAAALLPLAAEGVAKAMPSSVRGVKFTAPEGITIPGTKWGVKLGDEQNPPRYLGGPPAEPIDYARNQRLNKSALQSPGRAYNARSGAATGSPPITRQPTATTSIRGASTPSADTPDVGHWAEPRQAPFATQGEEAWSMPRTDDPQLQQAAQGGNPKAQKVMQRLGQKGIIIPREAGYPGPRSTLGAQPEPAPPTLGPSTSKATRIGEQAVHDNPSWNAHQIDSEITRLRGVLSNPAASETERQIATSQLENYRQMRTP